MRDVKVWRWGKEMGDYVCWRCRGRVAPGDPVCFTGPPNLIGDIPREPAHERCERAALRAQHDQAVI